PIEPKRWQPPRVDAPLPPATEVSPRVISLPETGEDPAVLPDGTVVTGLADGRIVKVGEDGTITDVARVGTGQILGIEVHPDGGLVCCAADDGLFRVDTDTGKAVALTTEVEGRPLVLTNNAHVAADGTIFFTESTTRFSLEWYRGDILEHSMTGSAFARSPSGEIDHLLGGLAFANGIVEHPDGDSILVAETAGYAIHRVWLGGDRAGQADVFFDGSPGFFDNLSVGPTGTIWAPVVNPRNPILDALLPRSPLLRKLVWATPEKLQPQPTSEFRVLGFAADGTITHHLEGPGDTFGFVTGVREHEGRLWLASVERPELAVVDLPT
ncbi:MAG: SMP-30/gluconolactonase/LRE family protein, partial [Nitriliruptorales bacterium]|nr:SMP-30/gluconolactonase/LRE family protein [Nitriliruptorales bacterium]